MIMRDIYKFKFIGPQRKNYCIDFRLIIYSYVYVSLPRKQLLFNEKR